MSTHSLQNIEQTVATHAEKVSSKRLAKQQNISENAALARVLQLSASKLQLDTIEQLAQWRFNEVRRIEQLHAEKRRQKLIARERKSQQIVLPDHVWHGWFDGSAKPNPGNCQIGCLLKGPNGERHTHQQSIGHGTSSDAEYQALIGALHLARQHNITQLHLQGDSQVVIADINSEHEKTRSVILEPYRLQALALVNQFDYIHIRWIPRHKNVEADALSQTIANNDD